MPENLNNKDEIIKKVDGIKKFSGTELEKSRKIVLATIGEDLKLKSDNAAPINGHSEKMVDSLIYKNNNKTFEVKPVNEELPAEKKQISIEQKNNILKEIGAESENKTNGLKIIDKLKTKLKIPEINISQNKIFRQTAKNYAPNFKNIRPLVDELINKNESVAKTEKYPRAFMEQKIIKNDVNKKLLVPIVPIKNENKINSENQKKSARPKFNIKKIKFLLEKYTDNFFSILPPISANFNKIIIIFKTNWTKTFYIFLVGFFSFIFLYIIFIFLALKLNLDNELIRTAANTLPIPAIIYDGGVIDYFYYKDLKTAYLKETDPQNSNEADLKNYIIRNIFLNKLLNKYKITSRYEYNQDYESEIMPYMISDIEINQVAFNRIKKIRNMISSDEDFMNISEKYSDEQGKKIIPQNEMDNIKYKNKIEDLSLGEVSGIITQPEGFYIYRLNQKTESFRSFNYIFIKAKTLDEYLDEEVKKLKYLSLVD